MRKITLSNVVSTMLGQHCIRILSSQCHPNTSETTMQKKVTCAMLGQSAHIYFRRKTGCFKYVCQLFFNRAQHHQILALFVQCWLGSSLRLAGQQRTGAEFDWNKHTVITLHCLGRNGKLLKFLHILITAMYFKDRKWIFKTAYFIRSYLMVCKIIFLHQISLYSG